MKILRKKSLLLYLINISIFIFLFTNKYSFGNDIYLEIKGNNYTDKNVILSLIKDTPSDLSKEYSNYLIKTLDSSNLFAEVKVEMKDDRYVITVFEFTNINKIYFENNKRLKDDELQMYADELNLNNLNPTSINNYISEIKKIYESFGYNNVQINYYDKINEETNISDLYIDIDEGEITKISKIVFNGNDSISDQELKSKIKSKTKTLTNIFANNNFKKFVIENDIRKLENYYKNKGFINVKVNYQVEYLKTNKVNLYFDITEGILYTFSSNTCCVSTIDYRTGNYDSLDSGWDTRCL